MYEIKYLKKHMQVDNILYNILLWSMTSNEHTFILYN